MAGRQVPRAEITLPSQLDGSVDLHPTPSNPGKCSQGLQRCTHCYSVLKDRQCSGHSEAQDGPIPASVGLGDGKKGADRQADEETRSLQSIR